MTDNRLRAQDPDQISTADLAGHEQRDEDSCRDDPNQFPLSEGRPPLFPEGDADLLRTRWAQVQISFVDEPRQAVAGCRQPCCICYKAARGNIFGRTISA